MRLLLALLATLWLAPLAHANDDADDAAPAPTAFERFDNAFGALVVGPLATVMFFDLVFWDNTLPLGSVPPGHPDAPHDVGGERLEGWDADNNVYVWRAVSTAPAGDLALTVTEPKVFSVDVATVTFAPEDGWKVGTVTSGAVGLGSCSQAQTCGSAVPDGLPRTERATVPTEAGSITANLSAVPEGATLRVLTDRGPFPLLVQANLEGSGFLALPQRVPDTSGMSEVKEGSLVQIDGASAEVVDITDGEATLLASARTTTKDRLPNPAGHSVPLVVAWLVAGAVFLTLRMGFINLRGFGHALLVTAGKYDGEHDEGEISHFSALSSALSATVGLGNIAGVAIAVSVGGPGAIPWMVIAGFLGMSSKFTECTLGQVYRETDSKGQVLGGPMMYLDRGLAEKGLGPLGKGLAVLFALMCIGGSLGGGNMFQANQSYAAVAEVVPLLADYDWFYGIALMILVAMVIIGGIKRIGAAAGFIVPVMCGVYVLAAVYILLVHAADVPAAFGTMLAGAFSLKAGIGGALGALIQGFRRAAFSNEAGVGSASIAHSAAATSEPVREGIVALLEPFIDTIVVCTMTGLVVVITKAYKQDTGDGVLMTSAAFGSVIDWFPLVLTFAVVMFAFSTMISWSYYGERCATWLFGEWASLPYKAVFLLCTFLGAVFNLGTVLEFSDLMILGMAFPNILGLFILSGDVKGRLDDYWGRLSSGEMKRTK